jgi:dihydropteroate synthase
MAGFSDYPEDGYRDVVTDVGDEWRAARDEAIAAGLPREHVAFDPGLGFKKSADQSTELCARLGELTRLGAAIVVGPSRKSFVAAKTARSGKTAPPDERLGGTIAAVLACVRNGAQVVRVHDVAAVVQALRMNDALASASSRAAARPGRAPVEAPRSDGAS